MILPLAAPASATVLGGHMEMAEILVLVFHLDGQMAVIKALPERALTNTCPEPAAQTDRRQEACDAGDLSATIDEAR